MEQKILFENDNVVVVANVVKPEVGDVFTIKGLDSRCGYSFFIIHIEGKGHFDLPISAISKTANLHGNFKIVDIKEVEHQKSGVISLHRLPIVIEF